ncbi:protein MRG1-like isoform X1 [Ipomoea triloba]|uniref:protein MRG1-like isoform X1 n=1 Tax=Ipomoea triloba TaxID=35885 RepID=UPI00125D3C52|nr:protein MRG1-like isoform X1 [Ipomoea triloba]
MGNLKATITDDSDTVSDDDGATTVTDSPSSSPPPHSSSLSGPFEEGEEVLAYHNQCVYKAKIQKTRFVKTEWEYFVHYTGWNKNWDEWLGIDRLMKVTEENLRKQQELNKKYDMKKNEKARRGSQLKAKCSTGTRAKRQKKDVQKDKGVLPSEKLVVNIQIPSSLKKQLVDDCEFITHLGKLVQLPRSPSVNEILSKYSDYRLKKDGIIADSVSEILSGLQCYFDKALSAMLLYKNEREQYQEAITDGVSPSSVYGAEHLLRLFVKFPEILHHANIEDETVTELRQKLQDFLRFLQKNQSSFFLSSYIDPEVSDVVNKKGDD